MNPPSIKHRCLEYHYTHGIYKCIYHGSTKNWGILYGEHFTISDLSLY